MLGFVPQLTGATSIAMIGGAWVAVVSLPR